MAQITNLPDIPVEEITKRRQNVFAQLQNAMCAVAELQAMVGMYDHLIARFKEEAAKKAAEEAKGPHLVPTEATA